MPATARGSNGRWSGVVSGRGVGGNSTDAALDSFQQSRYRFAKVIRQGALSDGFFSVEVLLKSNKCGSDRVYIAEGVDAVVD